MDANFSFLARISSLFLHHVSNVQLLLTKKKRELNEYKAVCIIKGYFSLTYQALQKYIASCAQSLTKKGTKIP